MKNTTSEQTINKIKRIVGRHGIAHTVISDNGPQFTSQQFKEFAVKYGFKQIDSNPMYPQSNGQAERFVQTIKGMIKKCVIAEQDIDIALLNYRNTKIQGLDASPAQMLMSRTLRSRIPVIPKKLKPQITKPLKIKSE